MIKKSDNNLLYMKKSEKKKLTNGKTLWSKAKGLIPGGNMLFSKRPEMFLPEGWPTYFSKSSGCKVWDLDGNSFIDLSFMGVGTNILGYSHIDVDDEVKKIINLGNMSTLNCPEEVHLAEKLIEIHPWSEMAKFTRSGGEANSVAVRIARAASGKDNIAVCGYHGWHDWYLSANIINNNNLSEHLIPELKIAGVPKSLNDTVFPFEYNNIESLQRIINENHIGAIKMEVVRNIEPENGFLEEVRSLATKKNIILIFDECTSGFRRSYGGIHKFLNIEPDMAIFGKALGNGYAINAIIGKKEIMQSAQDSFISSTFWTERIGPTAALKTLEVMEKIESWKIIDSMGNYIREQWIYLSEKFGLNISILGIPSLTTIKFESENHLAYKTLISQEMLKKGYLANCSYYVCTSHTKEIVDQYFRDLEPIIKQIKDCEDGFDINKLLDGPVCHSDFKRLQ